MKANPVIPAYRITEQGALRAPIVERNGMALPADDQHGQPLQQGASGNPFPTNAKAGKLLASGQAGSQVDA